MYIVLPQARLHCDLRDVKMDSSAPLYILAARRGSRFINVSFRLLLDEKYEESFKQRVMRLIHDDVTDDHTVSLSYMNV